MAKWIYHRVTVFQDVRNTPHEGGSAVMPNPSIPSAPRDFIDIDPSFNIISVIPMWGTPFHRIYWQFVWSKYIEDEPSDVGSA